MPSGLLAYGGDLLPGTLLSAYCQGIFPWYSADEPILWWSPNPRCILFRDEFHIGSRSRRRIRNSGFCWSVDLAFEEVLIGCAMPRRDCADTWLVPEMQAAYMRMFELGYAHSFEIWQEERLVGGLYGLGLGSVFFGESMFRLASEASRAALVCLIALMKRLDIALLDCQVTSSHMLAMGAREVSRGIFLKMLVHAGLDDPDMIARGSWAAYARAIGEICGMRPRLKRQPGPGPG
ncbi:MAG: leucyl/phenylalanyl-tRNA--protein transferase [Desulfovibrio sp.]|nr:leucyl/phenylalanyl-tRNA--protein transferase [Desulfovibrio sp.]